MPTAPGAVVCTVVQAASATARTPMPANRVQYTPIAPKVIRTALPRLRGLCPRGSLPRRDRPVIQSKTPAAGQRLQRAPHHGHLTGPDKETTLAIVDPFPLIAKDVRC